MTLEELRASITALDEQLLGLLAKRQALSREVAAVKRAHGQPTRDFRREREVLLNARNRAQSLGLPPDLAEATLRLLIQSSLATQEKAQVAAQGRGTGRTALLIGGSGKMGGWLAEFLSAQGFRIVVADPVATDGYEHLADWRQSDLQEDLIAVATPLKITGQILEELAQRRPTGLIFDVGSLKTPLRAGLEALRTAGCQVTSLHPMFGPDTELLSGRHVIFIDMGSAAALAEAQALFASTMAERVVMSLEEHDRLIAYVLGLSHALNIAFFTALADSGEAAKRLAQASSTTYDAQVEVARRVAAESPDLYFEIQHLNAYGHESLLALASAIERILQAVRDGDAPAFATMMQRGKEYFAGRAREG
jgi:chorismate mutase/prephenate dehydrogenase